MSRIFEARHSAPEDHWVFAVDLFSVGMFGLDSIMETVSAKPDALS